MIMFIKHFKLHLSFSFDDFMIHYILIFYNSLI